MDLLKGITWRWFWSGNWPVLDIVPFFSKRYFDEWRNAIGFAPVIELCIQEEGVVTLYQGVVDQKELKQAIERAYEKDPGFLLTTMQDYETNTERDNEAIRKLTDVDIQSLSDEELISRFTKARTHLQYNRFIDHYDYYCERYLQHHVEEWLQTKLPEEEVSATLELITRPQLDSPASKERREFFKIVDEMKQDASFVAAAQNGVHILDKFPTFKTLLEHHLTKYGFLRVVVNAEPWTLDDLWVDIVNFVNGAPYVIEETRPGDNYDSKEVERANAMIEKLQPDENMTKLIRGIQRAIYLRLVDNWDQSLTTTYLRPVYEEFAKRIGVSYQKFKMFTDDEIIGYLKKKEKIPKTTVDERWKITIYAYIDGEFILTTGDEAKRIKELVQHAGSSKQQTSFQGTPAVEGTLTAKARVALNTKDAEAVQPEEILIAPSPSAYFVPSMRRAAALVTERGGVTNHAVVVAREKNIPCVVNVLDITKHVKTGAMIKIDGKRGTIEVV